MGTLSLKQTLLSVLKTDSRLWDENNELNQTQLIDLLEKYDESVLTALLSQADLKRLFFAKAGESFVFKMQDFRFFLQGSKIDNSYTQYANRIGLTDGKRYLKDSTDIVLDFPFKDCVLNGGQSSEDGEDIYFERDKDAQHSTAQHSTAQHSTAQHSTAQHSTAQHSTAQHSTAQHSTAQHNCTQRKPQNEKKFSSIKF